MDHEALYRAARILDDERLSEVEALAQVAALLPPASARPSFAVARVRHGAASCVAPRLGEPPHRVSAAFVTADGVDGVVELGHDQPPSEDERALVDEMADLVRASLDRRAATAALRHSEQRLELAMTTGKLGVWEWDVAANDVVWSASLMRLLGRQGERRGRFGEFAASLHPDDFDKVRQLLVGAPQKAGQTHELELRVRHEDGRYRSMTTRVVADLDDAQRVTRVLGVIMDITERRQLEAQLRQSQKMDAIGQLAGGLAHDFSNLITIIVGNADFLLDELGADDPRRSPLVELRQAADRAGTLTRQLLAISRKTVLRIAPIDPARLVGGLEPLLRRLLREDIALTTEIAPAVGRVRADAGQLEQVLMNLVVNARDALPRGGAIAIKVEEVTRDRGRFVVFAVSDTGTGITPEVRARIFEPFFTTKPAGKGSGLGLAVVFGIVTQSHGFVEVDSAPGAGTRFQVFLPRVDDAEAVAAPRAVEAPRGGDETVLVVEDDVALRRLAAAALTTRGYRVIDAGTGVEAIDAAAAHDGPIDLLVSDVVLPGMSGRDLAILLRAARPDLRVLLMSGYPADATVGETPFLPKPFSPSALAARVRDVLDQRD